MKYTEVNHDGNTGSSSGCDPLEITILIDNGSDVLLLKFDGHEYQQLALGTKSSVIVENGSSVSNGWARLVG